MFTLMTASGAVAEAIAMAPVDRLASWLHLVEATLWPLTILILAIIFRVQVGSFIERVTRFGIGPAAITASPPQASRLARAPGLGSATPPRLPEDPLILEMKTFLRQSLNLPAAPASPTEDLLTAIAAQWALTWQHERFYWLVFGSQISLLQLLNAAPVRVIDARTEFYEPAAKAAPAFYANYSFDQWLGFLIQWTTVAVADDRTTITPVGRQFLQYVAAQGLSFVKPL